MDKLIKIVDNRVLDFTSEKELEWNINFWIFNGAELFFEKADYFELDMDYDNKVLILRVFGSDDMEWFEDARQKFYDAIDESLFNNLYVFQRRNVEVNYEC